MDVENTYIRMGLYMMVNLNRCMEQEMWREGLQLIWATDDYLRYQGYWTERRTSLGLGLIASQVLEDQAEEAIRTISAQVSNYVQEKPLQAAGMAFAAGVLATLILSRR